MNNYFKSIISKKKYLICTFVKNKNNESIK